jgi:hypothetical protein
MSLFFLLVVERVLAQPLKLAATELPVKAATLLRKARRRILLVSVMSSPA